jgi:rhodanese-related sulfurtransferase
MRIVLAAFALVGLFAVGGTVNAADRERIDAAELIKRIDAQDASIIVVDVRSPEEFEAGHVPGAINIPHTHMPARLSELAPYVEKEIVLYCESGMRTQQAIARMKENGFTRVLHLDGDMAKWRAANRPVAQGK